MAHEWHRGTLTTSSWHGLENIDVMPDAETMIVAGESTGAWPVALRFEDLMTANGLPAPVRGLVGNYADGTEKCLGAVGSYYRATESSEWRELITAAVVAGGKPTGAFSLRGGTRVLATFDVGGNGIRTQLVLADSFDRSLRLTAGTTSIRVVCSNTMAAAMRADGEGMQRLTHTSSLESKVNILREAIADTIKTGEKVRDSYAKAEAIRLPVAAAELVFDKLFPKAAEGATGAAKTKTRNARDDAFAAMAMPINNAGSTLATLWNAATYLVDRTADGRTRDCRGDSDRLDSLLFGRRAIRLAEIQRTIQHTIEVVMANGEIQRMAVDDALSHGVDAQQVGRSIIADMLA